MRPKTGGNLPLPSLPPTPPPTLSNTPPSPHWLYHLLQQQTTGYTYLIINWLMMHFLPPHTAVRFCPPQKPFFFFIVSAHRLANITLLTLVQATLLLFVYSTYFQGESATYILNENTHPITRAIGVVSHTACKDDWLSTKSSISQLAGGVYFYIYIYIYTSSSTRYLSRSSYVAHVKFIMLLVVLVVDYSGNLARVSASFVFSPQIIPVPYTYFPNGSFF